MPFMVADLIFDYAVVIMFYLFMQVIGIMSGDIGGVTVIYLGITAAILGYKEYNELVIRPLTQEERAWQLGKMTPRRRRKDKRAKRLARMFKQTTKAATKAAKKAAKKGMADEMDDLVGAMATVKKKKKAERLVIRVEDMEDIEDGFSDTMLPPTTADTQVMAAVGRDSGQDRAGMTKKELKKLAKK